MTKHLTLSHDTEYVYEEPISYGLQQLRLTPKTLGGQTIKSWAVDVEGGTKELEFDDQHNNRVVLIRAAPDCRHIKIRCEGEVEVEDRGGVLGRHTHSAPLWLYRRQTTLTKPGARLRSLVKSVSRDGKDDIEVLHSLLSQIAESIEYSKGETRTGTSAEDAVAIGKGVCQDHAHIMIGAARLLEFPARYVSGYVLLPEDAEQSAGHAWAEVHVPHLGWVGFDVSNKKSPDDHYIRVACGLDYNEAAPVSGLTFGTPAEKLSVRLQVQQ